MAKKHWIYIKRGLSEDPKHRAEMGECIWLYMHIIDRADWETGIAYDWKDAEEAAQMCMPVDTLRYQRKKLNEMDYIRVKQKQHSQDIYIMEWKNPRDYGSETRNPRNEGRNELQPSNSEGLNQGLNQGSNQGLNQVPGQIKTPTSNSISQSSSSSNGAALAKIAKAYESEIGLITPFIADSLQDAAEAYPLKWSLDAIHEAAVQNKRNWKYIEAILKRWKAQGNQDQLGKPSNGNGPGIGPAPAINEKSVQQTLKELENKWNFTPAAPPSQRPRIGKAAS